MDQVFRETTLIASVFSPSGLRPFPIHTKHAMRTRKVIADQRLAEQKDVNSQSSASRPFPPEETDVRDRILELIGADSGASFSRLTGIAESSLRAYLTKGTKPGMEHLVAMAQARGVTIDWLATGREPKLRADLVEALKGVDKARLQTAIAAVTEGVAKSGKLVAIDKQAELINAAYELAKEHSKDFIVRFITIAAM